MKLKCMLECDNLSNDQTRVIVTSSVRAMQNAEIFTLTYGSMVRQLIADLEDVNEVNKQLDTM